MMTNPNNLNLCQISIWKNLINKINGFILIGLYYQKKRGFIVIKGISKHECRLIYLYVDKYYRQKSIGKHLLSEAKNTAKQLGYTKISLYVLSNNEIAQSLYKNSNFETTKLRMECSSERIIFSIKNYSIFV